jgi:hypothetical protein
MNQHPKRFERMSAQLLALDKRFIEADLFGIDGEAQFGVDATARCVEGGGIAVQSSKCYAHVTTSHLTEWSGDFLQHYDKVWKSKHVRYFFLSIAATNITSTRVLAQIQEEKQRFLVFGIQYEVWGPEQLYEFIRAHRHLVRRFLGNL